MINHIESHMEENFVSRDRDIENKILVVVDPKVNPPRPGDDEINEAVTAYIELLRDKLSDAEVYDINSKEDEAFNMALNVVQDIIDEAEDEFFGYDEDEDDDE